jgi:2-polyprenyl-3-methyl-5-hydroxy-6-metoxy-1,4-benzoquinol methylase
MPIKRIIALSHNGGNTKEISCRPCPTCIFCGARGTFIYKKLVDRLFGAPGEWNLKKCNNVECGVIWLDPQPLSEDIIKAYQSYLTHNSCDKINKTAKTRFYYNIKEKYWAQKYGYFNGSLAMWEKIIGLAISLHPIKKAWLDQKVMYLPAKRNGKLLDIGCGNGERIELMRGLGWSVEGIDFDETAVRVARRKELQVHCGTLDEKKYPKDHFDAIIMSHVFEHLYEPIDVLRECYRILKPNGNFIIVTPNSDSLTHRLFKRNWRGLEPPRHLNIMSMKSMKQVVLDVGFNIRFITSCVSSSYVLCSSYALKRGMSFDKGKATFNLVQFVILELITLINSTISLLNRSMGDELAVIATK